LVLPKRKTSLSIAREKLVCSFIHENTEDQKEIVWVQEQKRWKMVSSSFFAECTEISVSLIDFKQK
jgi:hypothetical protein